VSRKITIDPITRLEGHGKIEIFLDEAGEVTAAYFQVPELRGFESFCVGRHAEEMPNITNRICGVCPEAHHMAAVKALDMLFAAPCLPAARRIRELIYSAFYVTDHTTHFYCLGGPDFIVGPDAPKEERNILGVVRKVGLEAGKEVFACRSRNHELIKKLGGRGVHLCGALPGGWSVPVSPDIAAEAKIAARLNVEFALFTLDAFNKLVLANQAYLDLILSDLYLHRTYSMGTVDSSYAPNFYDGRIRIVDPDGGEFALYDSSHYLEHIAEHVEPWSYMKFPYLRNVGWQGFVDGPDSGVYQATPLARLNVADRMATPLAHAEFERFYETFGCLGKGTDGRNKPVHHRLATHWARVIEILAAAEWMEQLANHPELCDPRVRQAVTPRAGVGIGSVEAPRGTLTHHYVCNDQGVLTRVNLIVGTTNNNAPMGMSIARAAKGLIHNGKVTDGILNRVEMAFRLYDPCCSCATHAIGKAPLELVLRRSADGSILDSISRGDRWL
jgi:F420-non-reducing hydrogenase large subunit